MWVLGHSPDPGAAGSRKEVEPSRMSHVRVGTWEVMAYGECCAGLAAELSSALYFALAFVLSSTRD